MFNIDKTLVILKNIVADYEFKKTHTQGIIFEFEFCITIFHEIRFKSNRKSKMIVNLVICNVRWFIIILKQSHI